MAVNLSSGSGGGGGGGATFFTGGAFLTGGGGGGGGGAASRMAPSCSARAAASAGRFSARGDTQAPSRRISLRSRPASSSSSAHSPVGAPPLRSPVSS